MAESRRLGVALLAAGASRRFGESDKLAAMFRGQPLGEHAVRAIPVDCCENAWVVTSALGHPCEPAWRALGFEPVPNADADEGMGTSVALAARIAKRESLDALLIALADMPLVPAEHFSALFDEATSPDSIAVSAKGGARMPPAVFGSAHFAALAQLGGDTGARALLNRGRVVGCPADWLADIDTPEALESLE